MTKVCVSGLILLLAAGAAVGEQHSPAAFAVDDPELYFGFFSLHQAHLKMAADAKVAEARGVRSGGQGSNEMDSASLRAGFVRELGVTETDYDRLSTVAASILDRIDGVNQAVAKLRDEILAARALGQMRPNSDDQARAMALQQQRVEILRDGIRQLQSALSPAGWSSLHAYINDNYRSHIVRKELPRAQR